VTRLTIISVLQMKVGHPIMTPCRDLERISMSTKIQIAEQIENVGFWTCWSRNVCLNCEFLFFFFFFKAYWIWCLKGKLDCRNKLHPWRQQSRYKIKRKRCLVDNDMMTCWVCLLKQQWCSTDRQAIYFYHLKRVREKYWALLMYKA